MVYLRGGAFGPGYVLVPGADNDEGALVDVRAKGFATLNVDVESSNSTNTRNQPLKTVTFTTYQTYQTYQSGGMLGQYVYDAGGKKIPQSMTMYTSGFPNSLLDLRDVLDNVRTGRSAFADATGNTSQKAAWAAANVAAKKKLVLIGGSAGGNLIAQAALSYLTAYSTRADYGTMPKLSCVAVAAGPMDVRNRSLFLPSTVESVLLPYIYTSLAFRDVASPNPLAEAAVSTALSPVVAVANTPKVRTVRWLFIRGNTDNIIPKGAMEPMIDALNTRAGVRVAAYKTWLEYPFTGAPSSPAAPFTHGASQAELNLIYGATPAQCDAPLDPNAP